ncbi:Na+/H+ antiporter subunit C [Coralloluteibacterium stylophorae]|uniref:Na+/H+ antiporter subunit C n=1 Tax=Coralloluteibacterium stylophorae TaxID=1776034 RepID=A0A8J8AYM7_9GAMM|nr:Na+/H+ antiporter subunit C [Coralloluteibacterium stylophorae]MBS7457882.1 Na+/H+ antiporter subunit C [Coralloluteibacterium stylophorae]
MEIAFASAVGVLFAAGIYLLLRARSFEVVLGLTLLSYGVNLLLFSMGRLRVDAPPVLEQDVVPTLAHYTDPLPQALVLTAIVISFAMTAVLLVVALRGRTDGGSDHADGVERDAAPPPEPTDPRDLPRHPPRGGATEGEQR